MTVFVHTTVSREEVDSGSHVFDLHDRKGRQIGFSWSIHKLTTRLLSEEERKTNWGGYVFEDDDTVRFVGRTHAMRNGRHYGASVTAIYGKTLEGVRRAVVTRAANCEKRYAKLVAKGSV